MRPERLPYLKRAQDFQRPSSKPPALPPIAAEADDLKAIKKAVEDAAAISGGLWLSYLFLLFYLAVAVGAVTHVDLLLERSIDLPFLNNIKLPLLAFFILAPLLFLISHAYTMAHFVMLSDKAKRFHLLLREQVRGEESNIETERKAHEIRTGLRRQLPSNVFVQFLAGPDDMRGGPFGFLLKVVAWMTLAILPVALLLLLQLQFLPYHDSRISWWHRVALVADLALVWWLWRNILAGRGDLTRFAVWTKWAAPLFGGAVSLLVFWFSWFVATFSGEWNAPPLSYVSNLEPKTVENVVFYRGLRSISLPGVKIEFSEPESGWPANALRLNEFNIYEALKLDSSAKLDWKQHSIDLKERHLENADFRYADFGKSPDLRGALLQQARLEGAKLPGAWLDGAKLAGANLEAASLDSTHLKCINTTDCVEMQGANLKHAHLKGAKLVAAHFEGASLRHADLRGASLGRVRLEGASLDYAALQGALFLDTHLDGASLDFADIRGAAFVGSWFDGASLFGVRAQGAFFETNWMKAADFTGAVFRRNVIGGNSVASLYRGTLLPPPGYRPELMSQSEFEELAAVIKQVTPPDESDAIIKRINLLDCRRNITDHGNAIAPCDIKKSIPKSEAEQLHLLTRASVEKPLYQRELAQILKEKVCNGDSNAIYVLRGLMTRSASGSSRLGETGPELQALVSLLLGEASDEHCLVATMLTAEDKSDLRMLEANERPSEAKRTPAAQN